MFSTASTNIVEISQAVQQAFEALSSDDEQLRESGPWQRIVEPFARLSKEFPEGQCQNEDYVSRLSTYRTRLNLHDIVHPRSYHSRQWCNSTASVAAARTAAAHREDEFRSIHQGIEALEAGTSDVSTPSVLGHLENYFKWDFIYEQCSSDTLPAWLVSQTTPSPVLTAESSIGQILEALIGTKGRPDSESSLPWYFERAYTHPDNIHIRPGDKNWRLDSFGQFFESQGRGLPKRPFSRQDLPRSQQLAGEIAFSRLHDRYKSTQNALQQLRQDPTDTALLEKTGRLMTELAGYQVIYKECASGNHLSWLPDVQLDPETDHQRSHKASQNVPVDRGDPHYSASKSTIPLTCEYKALMSGTSKAEGDDPVSGSQGPESSPTTDGRIARVSSPDAGKGLDMCEEVDGVLEKRRDSQGSDISEERTDLGFAPGL